MTLRTEVDDCTASADNARVGELAIAVELARTVPIQGAACSWMRRRIGLPARRLADILDVGARRSPGGSTAASRCDSAGPQASARPGPTWYYQCVLATMLIVSACQAAATAEPVRILVLDLRTDGDTRVAALLGTEVASVLGRGSGLEVLSSEDLRRLADVAANRQTLGCGDDEACLAELGAAMGARYVVHGAIGTVGGATLVQLSLFDVQQARPVARESAEARSSDDVLAATRGAAARLRAAVVPEDTPRLPVLGLAVTGAGAAAALGSAAVAAVAYLVVVDTKLPSAGGPAPEVRQTAQLVGAVAVFSAAAGVAAASVGAGLLAFGVGE